MTGTPLDLLSLVGAGARLLGLGRGSQPEQANEDFAQALDAAKGGSIDSGRVVVSAPDLGVDLTADQLQRLAHAADAAEAQGASTAAVLIDGMVIKLDVQSRTAIESTPAKGAMMHDVDLVMAAEPTTQAAPSSDALLRRLSAANTMQVSGSAQG